MAPKKKNKTQRKKQKSSLLHYEITDEAITTKFTRNLPGELKEQKDELRDMAKKNPEQAIPVLLNLIDKHGSLPVLLNYLSVAYERSGDYKKVEETVTTNYKSNPDYLFAMTHYADLCLLAGNFKEVSKIFNNKFDLKLLFPKRNKFHISELIALYCTASWYFHEIGDTERATAYFDMLWKVSPHRHPKIRMLKRKIRPSFIDKILSPIYKKLQTLTKEHVIPQQNS